MSGINKTSFANRSSKLTPYREKLSEATIRELIELGIDPTKVTSEIEARALINKAKAKKVEKNKKLITTKKENPNNKTSKEESLNMQKRQALLCASMDLLGQANKISLGL